MTAAVLRRRIIFVFTKLVKNGALHSTGDSGRLDTNADGKLVVLAGELPDEVLPLSCPVMATATLRC